MSRNAISANPEHYIFKIFQGSMPPDPPGRPEKIFSRRRVAQSFFQDRLPPKQKILDRTLIKAWLNSLYSSAVLMFVMTVERRNLLLLKEFILNGRFSQNIYTCICKLSCIEVNI